MYLPRIQYFFFSSRRPHTRFSPDWSSDVCSSDLSQYYPHSYLRLLGWCLLPPLKNYRVLFHALRFLPIGLTKRYLCLYTRAYLWTCLFLIPRYAKRTAPAHLPERLLRYKG